MKYIFRGIVVFEYDSETEQMTAPYDEVECGNFNFCRFIPEDYFLLAKFFETAGKHAAGQPDVELKDIEVN